MTMTVDNVQAMLEIIRNLASEGDYASAHGAEDDLFAAVLRTVALRSEGNTLLAKSLEIIFERHCV